MKELCLVAGDMRDISQNRKKLPSACFSFPERKLSVPTLSLIGVVVRLSLTIKSEVAKDGSQQVHDKHGQDGNICYVLHSTL